MIIIKKSTTDCFIRPEVFGQVVTVGEWELKIRKSYYHQLIGKMTLYMKLVIIMRGSQKFRRPS